MPASLGFWVSRVVAACASGTPCVLLHSPKPLLCWNSKQGRTPNMDMGIAARGGTAMDDKEMGGKQHWANEKSHVKLKSLESHEQWGGE